MKTLEDMLKESSSGTKRRSELFAEQFNMVSNMLYTDYGIRSVHMSFIVRDILDRIYSGEQIVNINSEKMIHYHGHGLIPKYNSECYIIIERNSEEIPAVYYTIGDFFIDRNGAEHYRKDIWGWRYKDKEDLT